MRNRILISGFPGIGKSFLFKNKFDFTVSDSDSTNFSKNPDGSQNEAFPLNYIEHIKNSDKDVILISSHDIVRNLLVENNMYFYLVYPTIDCKEDYIERYISRGSPEAFITLLENNFNSWIFEIENFLTFNKGKVLGVPLNKGQFLSDVIFDIISGNEIINKKGTF